MTQVEGNFGSTLLPIYREAEEEEVRVFCPLQRNSLAFFRDNSQKVNGDLFSSFFRNSPHFLDEGNFNANFFCVRSL
jgi:hypothetical protein